MKLNDVLPDASAPDSINLSKGMETGGDFRLVTDADIRKHFKKRKAFSHKGTYGHALIIAGAEKTMGAALLAAMGCLHSGAGLTTAAIPHSGLTALNTSLPEVMYISKTDLLQDDDALKKYSAIGIGPGLSAGADHSEEDLQLMDLLIREKRSLIADADALPLLKPKLKSVPGNSILTPHVKEFDALFGKHQSWWQRLERARSEAAEKGIVIVLKNQYSFIVDQQGTVYVNPTGNPAMAQGGMGDVLTGIITSYAAQQYPALQAAVLGCYFHGRSGDDLAASHFNVSASRLAAQLPLTVKDFLK